MKTETKSALELAFAEGKLACSYLLEDQARKLCARILAYRDVLEGDLDQAPLYHRLFGIMNRAFARLERRAEARRLAFIAWDIAHDNHHTQQIALAVDAEAFQKVDAEALQKTESDPACNSGHCNSCSVFLAGGCMSSFTEFEYPNSGDIFAAPHASAPDLADCVLLSGSRTKRSGKLAALATPITAHEAGQGGNLKLNLYRHKVRFFARSIPLLLQRLNGSRPFSASSVRLSVQGGNQ